MNTILSKFHFDACFMLLIWFGFFCLTFCFVSPANSFLVCIYCSFKIFLHLMLQQRIWNISHSTWSTDYFQIDSIDSPVLTKSYYVNLPPYSEAARKLTKYYLATDLKGLLFSFIITVPVTMGVFNCVNKKMETLSWSLSLNFCFCTFFKET